MKMWKKLMVPVLVIVLTSALMGAQYIAVETDATLQIDTEEADLQIVASDPSLSDDGQEYLLEYDGEGFELDLGTWGEQNTFTSSQAFLLVNAGNAEIQITDLEIDDTDVGNNVDIYLSWEEDEDGSTNGQIAWENTAGDQLGDTSGYHLNYLDDTYLGDGDMEIWHTDEDSESTGIAELKDYEVNGDGTHEHWVYDDTTIEGDLGHMDAFDSGFEETPNANAVWVHIEVVTETDLDDPATGTLTFNVDYVE